MALQKDNETAASYMDKIREYKGIFKSPPLRVPITNVTDAPIAGNGDLGLIVSGTPELQRYYITKADFWKFKLLGEEDDQDDGLCLPGGLDIFMEELRGGEYRVEQTMFPAEIHSSFKRPGRCEATIKTWVAAEDSMAVVELEYKGAKCYVETSLWSKTGNDSETLSGKHSDGVYWAVRKFNSPDLIMPSEISMAMRVIGKDSTRFFLEGFERVVFVIFVASNHDRSDYFEYSCRSVESITDEKLAKIRKTHDKWWENFWSKSGVDIGDKLLEKYWYGSQYVLACCSRNVKFPPGLYGNFVTTDKPAWGSDYHLNYNYESAWWGIYSSNRVELSEPYDTPILEFMEEGRNNAKKYLDCRGVYYDVAIGPKGFNISRNKRRPYDDGHTFHGQKSNAAFCAINLLMKFYHTYDLDYAREIAYPFLKEVGDFWEDYLIFENGRYIIKGDCVKEEPNWKSRPGYSSGVKTYYTKEDEEMENHINNILSLGLVRALFKGLLDISKELGADENRREKWEHILENLSEFPLMKRDGRTVFRLTEKGIDWDDSNVQAIQHIYPAGQIGLGSDPRLIEISRDTITALDRWNDTNGFVSIFPAAVRVGYHPDIILRKLREKCVLYGLENFMIEHTGGGIECVSTVPNTINEMLMQSYEGIIRLFPVWPKHMPAKFYNLRAKGAFLVSSEYTGGKVHFVKIKSEKGKKCILQNPWLGNNKILLEEYSDSMGKQITGKKDFLLDENEIIFETRAGYVYYLGLVE